jgi:two-component system nitrogen regulation sensor histidine kinase GlnL|tara:strand:- start:131 stop:1249 length:1119 start_codon:yes stop_codon:yes gene_type:complete
MTLNSLYRQLIDNMTTAVLVVDSELRLRHLNPATESLLSISQSSVCGEPITRIFEQAQSAEQALHQSAAKLCAESDHSSPSNRYTQRQVNWHLHDGRDITVDYSVTPIEEQQLLLIEIQPVDRMIRMNREKTLIAAQETSRQLIRGMAHEVKNPLGGIRGAAQLLEREITSTLPSSDLKEYTSVIIDEADRLRNLVDRMLGPNQPANTQAVNIHQVLERVFSLIAAECGDSIQLSRDYDPSIPEFNADAEQLIQACLNIGRNAVQALQENNSPSNADSPHITLRSRIKRQFTIGEQLHSLVCQIDVVDNGPGINRDIAEDIFYPMISGRAQGSGLGLTIAQQLINQHGGLIQCASKPGQTCFSIYLPFTTAH